jgi:hypothetical protein
MKMSKRKMQDVCDALYYKMSAAGFSHSEEGDEREICWMRRHNEAPNLQVTICSGIGVKTPSDALYVTEMATGFEVSLKLIIDTGSVVLAATMHALQYEDFGSAEVLVEAVLVTARIMYQKANSVVRAMRRSQINEHERFMDSISN